MYLISLYFDEKSNKMLQSYIDKIAKKTGNTFMTDNHVPPHMTISSIEARSEQVLLPAFEGLRGKLSAGEVNFFMTGQFFPYVMCVQPALNEYLTGLSSNIYEAFKNVPETTISKYYRPLSWMPHVTVGKTLEKEQMQTAFFMMQENFRPFEGRVEKIGLSKVNPHEDVSVIEL